MDNLSFFSIANLAVNQMIVIDVNGDIQVATIGNELPAGSIIIQRGDEPGYENNIVTQRVDENNELQDVTDEVADLFAALEEGQDPTQIDEELAPAAGGASGSSLTDSASVERVGVEIIANTDFTTSGFDALGFSHTQSLALINLFDENTAPQALNDVVETNEDTEITIDVLSNDTDPDGDTLTLTSATVAEQQGAVSIVGGQLVFTPAVNFNGEATITYTISDGNGGTDEATVTVTVNAVNDAPQAENDVAETDEDSAVITIDVLSNDSDVDGDSLTISSATVSDTQGSVSIVDGKLEFTPAENFNGDATITYTISDGNGGTDEATVTVTVKPVNDAPVAVAEQATVYEDSVITGTVTAKDVDLGDDASLVFSTTSIATGLTLNADGSYEFDASSYDYLSLNEKLVIEIPVTVTDEYGETDTTTLTINVIGTNDAPIAIDDTGSVDATTGTLTGNVLDNDTDIDNPHDDLTVTTVRYNGNDYPVDEVAGAEIPTPSGTLHIFADGGYEFVANTASADSSSEHESDEHSLNNITLYGINTGSQNAESYIRNLDSQESNTDTNGAGTGIGNGSQLNVGESIIVDLQKPASSASFSLGEVKEGQISISVFDSEGNLLTLGEDYTYEQNVESGSKITVSLESIQSDIQYVVFGVNDIGPGNDFYRVQEIILVAVEYNDSESDKASSNSEFEEQFTYTVEDGDGGTNTAELIIKGDIPVDSEPTITFEIGQDSITVSEEGLTSFDANPDNEGTSDTTDDVTATGSFTVNDTETDIDNLTVSLVTPETTLYSNNVEIKWSTENGKLIGKAGDQPVLEISLEQDASDPGSYDYSVALLGPVDHNDVTAEDTLSFDFDIAVSDGTHTVKESITVTVEDDSPESTENIVVTPVQNDDSTVPILSEFSFTQKPNESGCHWNNSFTFSNASTGQSIFVYALGFLNNEWLSPWSELTFSEHDGMGVKSRIELDRTDGEIDFEYGRSEQIVMKLEGGTASSVQLNLTQFYSNESWHHGENGKITFYLDGHQVDTQEFSATSANGLFTGEFVADSEFNEIRLEATNNGNWHSWSNGHLDNSDFAVKSVSFSSAVADPVIATDEGTIDADFGADGAGEIILTGIENSELKTADDLSIKLESTTNVGGIQTQVWVDSHGDKVFEIDLNSTTGEWSYKQYAELKPGQSIELTYDVKDADGDTVSSISSDTDPDPELPDLVAGLQGEFYNVDKQIWSIDHAKDVIHSQCANAEFIATDIHYHSMIAQDDLGGLIEPFYSNLQLWLGDDGSSVKFNDRKDTNDAVIKLSGGVEIAAGSYTMRVIADDGYQIKLDGEIVASYDHNTYERKEEFSFDIDDSGIHDIEIIYWDQGGAYVLDVAIGDNKGHHYEQLGGDVYPTYQPGESTSFSFADFAQNLDSNIQEFKAAHSYDGVELTGTSHDDTLVGGAGNDHLSAHNSQDKLFGKSGADWLEGGDGDDYLEGNCGDDWLIGDSGDDDLYGGSGNDLLEGGLGQDFLYGGAGNDILVGGEGNDWLFGGDSNDILVGDSGHDYLTGGSGHDLFVLGGELNSTDTIVDFSVQQDAIDITDLLSIDRNQDHSDIQDYLNSSDSSFAITANGDGSASMSIEDNNHAKYFAGSFASDSHVASGDVISVLFDNHEYTVKVDS